MNQEKHSKQKLQYKKNNEGKLIKYINWFTKDRSLTWDYEFAIIIEYQTKDNILVLNNSNLKFIEKCQIVEIYNQKTLRKKKINE